MIKYRPHKGGLEEAMNHSRSFSSIEEMVQYIASTSDGMYEENDIIIDDMSLGEDKRIGWKDVRYVLTRKIGDVHLYMPFPIGFCDIYDYSRKEQEE